MKMESAVSSINCSATWRSMYVASVFSILESIKEIPYKTIKNIFCDLQDTFILEPKNSIKSYKLIYPPKKQLFLERSPDSSRSTSVLFF